MAWLWRLLIALDMILLSSPAQATWSLIVLDTRTHQIGIAGASCSDFVAGIEGYSPGKGAVVAQAMSNIAAKGKALELLNQGRSPQEIVALITDVAFDQDAAKRQYAVASFDFDRIAAFTGSDSPDYHGVIAGRNFSVQGNTLTGAQVLEASAFVLSHENERANFSLADTLMRALEAGAVAGGDKRCGRQHATSAFITVVKPDMDWWDPYLHLHVHHVPPGSKNAVELLRVLYTRWDKHHSHDRSVSWSISPSPVERDTSHVER